MAGLLAPGASFLLFSGFFMLLKDQIALITGFGPGGIGPRHCASFCERRRCGVSYGAHGEGTCPPQRQRFRLAGGRSGYAQGRFVGGESEMARQAVEAAREKKFGRIDILVNNAGHYGPVVPVEDYPLADFRQK